MLVMSTTTFSSSCAFASFNYKSSLNDLAAIVSELVICSINFLLTQHSFRLVLVRYIQMVLEILGCRYGIKEEISGSDYLRVSNRDVLQELDTSTSTSLSFYWYQYQLEYARIFQNRYQYQFENAKNIQNRYQYQF